MALSADGFIRRFRLHVPPRGCHRIRHYGLLAGSARKASLALARELLDVLPSAEDTPIDEPLDPTPLCPCCRATMTAIEVFARRRQPRAPPSAATPIRSIASLPVLPPPPDIPSSPCPFTPTTHLAPTH